MPEFDPVPGRYTQASPLISEIFLYYLNLSGLYPFATDKNAGKRNLSVSWCWLVAITVSALSLINFVDYTMSFLEDIESMKFFKLIIFFVRADLTFQTAAIFGTFLLSKDQIYEITSTVAILLKDVLPRKQLASIQKTSWLLAFGWISLWQCMHLFGYLAYIWDDLCCWECLTRPTSFLSTSNYGQNMPTYLDYLITGSSKLLDTNTELTAQCFYFMLVYLLGTGFHDVKQRLEIALHTEDKNVQIIMVREAGRLYLRLRTVTNKFNDCFGMIGLLIFLRDAFSFMLVTTLTLRVYPPQELDQSLEDYQADMKFYESQAKHDFIVGCIGLANAVVQMILCLRCHSKVQVSRKILQELEASAVSLTMQEEYQQMTGAIDSTSGAISAGALFITKESIASSLGLFAGYGVLVYQTRDSIVGDQQYAKKKDLPQLAGLILNLLQNTNVSSVY